MDNHSTSSPWPTGAIIYDNTGALVGTVTAFHVENGYLEVLKGVFIIEKILLPMSTVDHTDAENIYLNVSRDDLPTIAYKPALDSL